MTLSARPHAQGLGHMLNAYKLLHLKHFVLASSFDFRDSYMSTESCLDRALHYRFDSPAL